MSARKVTCPKCQKAFGLLERQLGTDVYCPHCGLKVKIQAPPPPVDAFQEAAAQLAGGDRPPRDSAPPAARSTSEDAAASALEAALGSPAPAARPGAAQRSSAAPTARPAAESAPSRPTSGLDNYLTHPQARPGQNKTLAWVSMVVVVLGVFGLLGGIWWNQQSRARREAADKVAYDRQIAKNQAEAAKRAEQLRQQRIARGDVAAGEDTTSSQDGNSRNEAPEAATPDPLVFHLVSDKAGKPITLYHETPAQREVLLGYLENIGEATMRRVDMSIWAAGGETEKVVGEAVMTFRDVKPGEKAFFAFDYPFVNEKGTKWGKKIAEIEAEMPEYDFEVTTGRVQRDGRTSGVVTCSVTNNSTKYMARKVELLAILFDATNNISGYARGEVYDIGATKTGEAKIRWENWDSEFVQRAEVRAQIAPRS